MPCLLPLLLMTTACGPGFQADDSLLLADFPASISETDWDVVDDGVMGGRSQGRFRLEDDALVFTGTTNTEAGGFSSIRSQPRRFDLEAYDGIRLRARGDGRTYTFRLTTSDSQSGSIRPSYWADFETRGEDWEVSDIPFHRFRPRWREQRLDGPALNKRAIDGLGIMIYDEKDGPFRLEVDTIHAYREPLPLSMDAFRWKNRPLLLFADHAEDAQLRQVLADVEATREAFNERDMVLIVVLDRGGSYPGTKALSASDAKRLRSKHGVSRGSFALRFLGKDGGVMLERGDAVDMESLYAQVDAMPMRQQEMRRGQIR